MNKYSADELFKIAYSHLQKKEFEKSTQLFEKLLNDYPDNLSILRNLSHSYAFSGAFRKAEKGQEENAPSWIGRGSAVCFLSSTKAGLAFLQSVLTNFIFICQLTTSCIYILSP